MADELDGDTLASRAPSDSIVVLIVARTHDQIAQVGAPLSVHGFRIIAATSGDEALTQFAQGRASVVMLAADMPRERDYVDGYDICQKLQALPGSACTPVLMLDRTTGAIHRAKRAGATDVITDVIDLDVLVHRLRTYVAAARAVRDAHAQHRQLSSARGLARLAQWELDLSTRGFRWTTDDVFGISGGGAGDLATWLAWIDPTDRDRVRAAFDNPSSHDIEFRMQTPDGRLLVVHQQAKVELDELDGAIRLIGVAQDISELRRAEAQIHELAFYDSLTHLPNRTFLRRFLGHATAAAERSGQRLAVLGLDLDHFKRVNDTLGHAAGDALLAEAARRMQACIRGSDAAARGLDPYDATSDEGLSVASRLGGDEFVIVLNQLTRADDAALVARRINEQLARPFEVAGHQVFVSSSIGIALFPDNGCDPDELLARADAAMYHAKASGRNTFAFFSPAIQDEVRRRTEIDARLRATLAGDASVGALVLHFQPKVRLPDHHVTGAEALVRWRLADGTMIPPNEFIGNAEDTGVIHQLGRWVLEAACEQAARWRAEGRPLPIAVNVSPRQLADATFPLQVADVLQRTGLPATLLELEVTEAAAMHDTGAGRQTLAELKKLGVRIALDDFGTGYSSLSWLARLPIDTLKIDRAFVRALGDQDKNDAVAQTIVELAHRLNIAVVAEGIETTKQLLLLQSFGRMDAQGFLFARPMPAAALAAWIAEHEQSTHAALLYPQALLAM